jgi:hypothetical protein
LRRQSIESAVIDQAPWFDVDAMKGIGKLYAGGCDKVRQLPPHGSPEREASDKRQTELVRGLLAAAGAWPASALDPHAGQSTIEGR